MLRFFRSPALGHNSKTSSRVRSSSFARALHVELLEDRRLLSLSTPALSHVVNWQGQQVEAAVDQWLVRLAAGSAIGSNSVAQLGTDAELRLLNAAGSIGLLDAPGVSMDSIQTWVSATPGVLGIEPNLTLYAMVLPDDTVFDDESTRDGLWGLHNEGQEQLEWDGSSFDDSSLFGTADADIDAPEAWARTTGSRDVVIGVIDSGIDYTHPDLYLNVWVNQGEIPSSVLSQLTDVDDDDQYTFVDFNDSSNTSILVGGNPAIYDWNSNGYIDAWDLLNDGDATNGIWENSDDGDGNGYDDDLIGWNFDDNNNDPLDDHFHGTHVSGTIGAVGNDDFGIAGVNWEVLVVPLKFVDSSGFGTLAGAIEAVSYSTAMRRDDGVNLVATSNSWGLGPLEISSHSGLFYSQSLFEAIEEAGEEDILFIAAAGNVHEPVQRGQDNDLYPAYPASYSLDNIMSVAATDADDLLPTFSSYGHASVDLGAPGVRILSTFPTYQTDAMDPNPFNPSGYDTDYETISGTSMATPHVTGVVALLAATIPSATGAQIKDAILSSVDPVASLRGNTVSGGRLNAAGAVAMIDPIVVSTTTDEVDTDYSFGDLSLREALYLASTQAGLDVIRFDSSLANSTITVSTSLGYLSVNSDVIIQGLGADDLTISGGDLKGVFLVSGVQAMIRDLTIADGNAGTGGNSLGGAIRSGGNLTLDGVVIKSGNAFRGGGIYQYMGSLSVFNSTITDNDAVVGGGIYVDTSELIIHNSTIDTNSTLNSAGLYITDTNVDIVNTTISSNTASSANAGGVYLDSLSGSYTANFINVTVANNSLGSSNNGGGIRVESAYDVTLTNTIVAGNTNSGGADDVYGTFNSDSDYNLIGSITGSTDLDDGTHTIYGNSSTPLDAKLLSLGDYGGPTRTHMLRGDSPAINARDAVLWWDTGSSLSYLFADQRGRRRFDPVSLQAAIGETEGYVGRDVSRDMGAVEASLMVTIAADENDSNYSYDDLSLREALYLAEQHDHANTIEFSPELLDSTITLSLGPLVIDSDVAIVGLGTDRLTISGGEESQVFLVEEGAIVSILDLTVADGVAPSYDKGGGIYNEGDLILLRLTVRDNVAYFGGGIANEANEGGSLYIYDSTIADNTASTSGGGLGVDAEGTSNVDIVSSTFYGNEAENGAGIYVTGSAQFAIGNSTISGNDGEGIRATGAEVILGTLGSTIAYNTESSTLSTTLTAGGVVANDDAVVIILNTIVAENTGGDINGSFNVNSDRYLIGNGDEGDLVANLYDLVGTATSPIDPRLDVLDNYGGLVKTHALLSDSPARDIGQDAYDGFWFSDQRGPGFDRFVGSSVDLGAYEYGAGGSGGGGGGSSFNFISAESPSSQTHVDSRSTVAALAHSELDVLHRNAAAFRTVAHLGSPARKQAPKSVVEHQAAYTQEAMINYPNGPIGHLQNPNSAVDDLAQVLAEAAPDDGKARDDCFADWESDFGLELLAI